MTRHRSTATAIAGVLAVTAMMLTACTPSEATPTKTPTASAMPTPEQTGAPTQAPVAAPKDESEAVAAANTAYIAFQQAQFDFMADPELGTDYLENFVWPGTRMETIMQDTYNNKVEMKTSVQGEPFGWQANEALSYVSPLTNQSTGEVDPLGSVNLFGCSDNTGTTFLVGGVENADIPKGSFPYHVELLYSPDFEGWFVSNSTEITGQEGAPLC
ncbi:hypothetical protein DC31_06265 [Microbacterium sp. CH12i]|uniref:hypothetical protein n=1 Tax=Microbacterium sp. CH12i TaxID=1479651 RepID=UPI0004616BBE|nr:hypothetical protein [Microbacterium sp. CH12i]KDA04598.1 hypothetical protein DC31_06265 [Microbacterium sp. CH12i]